MENNQPQNQEMLSDILEAVIFIKDNAVNKIEFNELVKRVDSIDSRLNRVESQMVTKDYFDQKLFDLKGDLVVTIRKEDDKFKTLVELLNRKKVITEEETRNILALEPFPKFSI